jgi:SAM-dependent methyltransferase
MSGAESERYWDERARENALFYVDNEADYDNPDVDAFWRRGDEVLDRLVAMTGHRVGPDDEVLDIGCGIGRMTRALAVRVRHVHALDVSSEMLRLARERNADLANVTWHHGDGTTLRVLGDASVDGCFSHVVFQHLPDARMTLGYVREMGRVLRPGGWALFQVSTDPRIHRPPRRERLRALLRGRNEDRAWWGSPVDPDALRAAAADGGLEIEQLLDAGTQFTTVLARRR